MKVTLPFGRKKAHIGVVIEDAGIRIAEAKKTSVGYTMQQAALIPVEHGDIVGGKILNGEAVELQLALAVKDFQVKKKKAVLAVPSSFVVIRKVNIPKVKPAEVRPLLEIELESTIHLPFSRPYFDFYKVENESPLPKKEDRAADDEGLQLEEDTYLLVAAPGDCIDQYVSLMKTFDIEVIAVDIEPLALYRLLYAQEPDHKQNIMFVQLGIHSVNVSIFQRDMPEFLRNIPLALANYEVAATKQTYSASDLGYLVDNSNLYSFVNDLVRELERVISFYQFSMKNDGTRVETIYITGNFPSLEHICHFLQQRMNSVEVTLFPIHQIAHAFEEPASLHGFTVAVGLSLRG